MADCPSSTKSKFYIYDPDPTDDHSNLYLLKNAIQKQDIQIVKKLLEDLNLDINIVDVEGRTALHCAVEKGSLKIIHLLLKHGANINASDDCGLTPLFLAIDRQDKNLVQNLLKNGADVNISAQKKITPLHYAIYVTKCTTPIVKLLLEAGAKVNQTDLFSRSPLHLAVVAGRIEIVKLLLENQAIVDIPDLNGRTPLHCAASSCKDVRIISLLVCKNADINTQCRRGMTALHYALENDQNLCLQKLLDRGASTNLWNRKGETPLIDCIQRQNMNLFNLFLAYGANPNLAGSKGSPLHYAVKVKDTDFCRYLLCKNANVNAVTVDGSTVLHYAVEAENSSAVQLLLQKRANFNIKRKSDNRSALEVAVEGKITVCAEVFLRHIFELKVRHRKVSYDNLVLLSRFVIALYNSVGKIQSLEINADKEVTKNIRESLNKISKYLKNEQMSHEGTVDVTFENWIKFLSLRRKKRIQLWDMSYEFLHYISTVVLDLTEDNFLIFSKYFCDIDKLNEVMSDDDFSISLMNDDDSDSEKEEEMKRKRRKKRDRMPIIRR